MRILIIDNEKELRSLLWKMLLKFVGDEAEMREAEGVAMGLQQIHAFRPEIVFLDIEMEDGTAFDLLSQLSDPGFQLIFTTAHNQYAIRAIKFSALDYLMKPINQEELQIAFQRAVANIDKASISSQLAVVMQQLENKTGSEKKIVLNDKQSTYFIRLSDILFCEAEGPYTKFYITGIAPILISRNLKEYETMLVPMGFIRTHHSYIANPDKIKMYDKTDGGELILEGGHSIPVSQRRKEMVMDILTMKK